MKKNVAVNNEQTINISYFKTPGDEPYMGAGHGICGILYVLIAAM